MGRNTNKAKKIEDDKHILKDIRRIHGALGKRIGDAGEARVIRAFRWEVPWVLGVKKATKKEDACGIDCHILTDVGWIPLQVKTSKRGKKQFQKDRGLEIPIVIIDLNESDHQIRQKVIRAIASHRKKLLIERKR